MEAGALVAVCEQAAAATRLVEVAYAEEAVCALAAAAP